MRNLSLLLLWGCCGLCSSHFFSTESTTTDVNECEDTTICPSFAICTNTMHSYYCTCKQGFLPSNGLTQFRGPGVTCEDTDECSQNPQACGPSSICRNLPGRYKCSCLPGFSSPTGNDWTSVKLGRFSCKDVDECADIRICPEHATCNNRPGSYSCVCNQGFASSSGNTSFQGSGETCEDVDECARNSTLCGLNSICTNTLGGYHCSCLPGFFSPVVWTPDKPEDFRCT
ncbi:adhesion G protein-coupled receptor E1-like, partial [Hyaena hyaena]|uniref:adhesion G protein-coupled receptor E1-like n=1 Tax=Hyaena hyaena TaxID=95912 RepID=UPI001923B264